MQIIYSTFQAEMKKAPEKEPEFFQLPRKSYKKVFELLK